MSQPSFYSPDTAADDYEISVLDSDLTNVDYGFSFLYKNVASGNSVRWLPQVPKSDYNPGNLGTYPNPPTLTTKGPNVVVVN